MAEGVRRDVLGQSNPAAGLDAVPLQGGRAEGAVGGLAGEEQVARPVAPPVVPQLVEQPPGQGDATVLLALTLADVDEHAAGVEVGNAQVDEFVDAEAAGVQGAEDHARGWVGESVEDGMHLGAAEHDRQGLGLLAVGDEGDSVGALQDVRVEEAEGGDGLVEEAPGDTLVLDEVELELTQVVGSEVLGGALEMVGEATDAGDVGFGGAWRIVAAGEFFEQALA